MAKILVVDDEQLILEAICDVLGMADHEAVGVSDAKHALAMLSQQHFDLALVDVMMPEMNGYHLAAKIHGLANPPKVIIATARHYEDDERTLKIIGVSAFISKPFSNRDLLELISKVLKEKSEGN